ncbi:hypothetical protein E2542_SST15691 [Spatholobus suberectus]|nr:hypothetical protein E2542_SST15691 [Spatholobus suberectus]
MNGSRTLLVTSFFFLALPCYFSPRCGGMASLSTFLTLTLFLFSHVKAKDVVIPEDGYTVTTVFDGHKPHIYPFTVLQLPVSSDLILLDSVNSTFYTAQFPISQARFAKPRSFAIDLRGNVYVADRSNHAIRKISAKGVTTIAGGGYSEKSNRKDGPALSASFSNDFDLTFIPGLCALLVSDHMHQLLHQINLKEEDCSLGSKSGLGAVLTWTLALGLSCVVGLVIGFVVRPYILPNVSSSQLLVKILYCLRVKLLTPCPTELCRQKGSNHCHFIETWKHCLTSLGKLLPILFFGAKSAIASRICSSVCTVLMRLGRLCLCHLDCMFRIRVNIVSSRPHLESVSLLDLDACNSGEVSKPSNYHDQLKDLMSFDEDSTNATFNKGNDSIGRRNVCHDGDVMIKANMGFVEPPKDNILHQESSVCNLGVVKRR